MRASRGEIKIEQILMNADIDFVEEYSFPDLVSSSGRALRFDFCIFDDEGNIDFLIEYQGIQHYEAKPNFGGAKGLFQQQYNDNMKKEYCQKHGIRLICIPYWEESFLNFDYIMRAAHPEYF